MTQTASSATSQDKAQKSFSFIKKNPRFRNSRLARPTGHLSAQTGAAADVRRHRGAWSRLDTVSAQPPGAPCVLRPRRLEDALGPTLYGQEGPGAGETRSTPPQRGPQHTPAARPPSWGHTSTQTHTKTCHPQLKGESDEQAQSLRVPQCPSSGTGDCANVLFRIFSYRQFLD